MNADLERRLTVGILSRRLDPKTREELAAHARSIPQRLEVMREVEAAESALVREALDRLKPLYPKFAGHHAQAWAKGERDVGLVLRNAALGMFLGDTEFQDKKMLHWVKSILASASMTPGFVRQCYDFLRQACERRLSASGYALMEPHLTRVIEVLSDLPEPVSPRV